MNERARVTAGPSASASFASARSGVLQRKCACGSTPGPTGECSACRRERGRPGVAMLQPKLRVSRPGDRYEREADHVAEQIMRMPEPSAQRPEALVQHRAAGAGSEVPAIVHDVLRSPGQPLGLATRRFMESRLGHAFDQVRLHTDAKAVASARAVDAQAYTVGRDVVFDRGEYDPTSFRGRRLLAHELTHVIQQSHDFAHADVGLARQERKKPEPTRLSPEELVSMILHQRGFTGKQASKGDIGHGFETHAAVQLLDKQGKVVAHELGGHVSGKAVEGAARKDVPLEAGEKGKVHAERMSIGALSRRLDSGEIDPKSVQGGKLQIAVDQYPCPPSKKDCFGHLRKFADKYGLELEVYLPARSSKRGGGEVSPKTAARTAFKGPEVPGAKGGFGTTGSARVKQIYPPGKGGPPTPPVKTPPFKPGLGVKPRSTMPKPGFKPRLKTPGVTAKPGRGPMIRPPPVGRSGQRGAAAAEGIAAILGVAMSIYLQHLYAEELAEHERKKLQESLDAAGPRFDKAINDNLEQIARWQQSGDKVFLYVIVEKDHQDTEIGSVLMKAEILDVKVGVEGKPPPLAKSARSIIGDFVLGMVGTTIRRDRIAVPLDPLPPEAIKEILEYESQREQERKRREAEADRLRKRKMLEQMEARQNRQPGDSPTPPELLLSPGGVELHGPLAVDLVAPLRPWEDETAKAAGAADLFEAERDALVERAKRLKRASDTGDMTLDDYKRQYREFIVRRDAWKTNLGKSIAFLETEGGERYAITINRLKALEDWLGQIEGHALFEVAPKPHRSLKQPTKQRTVVAVDQAPLVPEGGGANIRLTKGTPLEPLSKPKGKPPFVKVRVVESGRVGWIQPGFISSR